MPNRSGEKFSHYRLIRLLGQGGFASVYLGKHELIGIKMAVKVLDDPNVTQADKLNFMRETTIISKLNHPNIVQFREFGERASDNILYLVMEYMPRRNISQLHPPGSILPITTVVSYVNQLASALQAVHDENIVHRDIKPQNILIGSHGELLLTDFGIAVPTYKHTLQVQDVEGTWVYAAPEHFRGRADNRSDIYSLAIVTYELLCGAVPFFVPSGSGKTANVYYGMHRRQPPPPMNRPGVSIPAAVEQVVLKALEKNPDDRYQTVMEYANALEQAAKQPIQQKLPPQPVKPPPAPMPLAPVPPPPKPVPPQPKPVPSPNIPPRRGRRLSTTSIVLALLVGCLFFLLPAVIALIGNASAFTPVPTQASTQAVVRPTDTPVPTATPFLTVTPTPVPATNISGLDLDGYCRSIGYAGVSLDGQYWHCLKPVDIDMTHACQWQYQRSDVVGKQPDPNNPYSWGCYDTSNTYVGSLDLNGYCHSLNYAGASLDGQYWHCLEPVGIDMTHACQWQYRRSDVVGRQPDPNNPYSWTCITAG